MTGAKRRATRDAHDDVKARVAGERVPAAMRLARDKTARGAPCAKTPTTPAPLIWARTLGRILCDLYDLHLHLDFAEIPPRIKFRQQSSANTGSAIAKPLG